MVKTLFTISSEVEESEFLQLNIKKTNIALMKILWALKLLNILINYFVISTMLYLLKYTVTLYGLLPPTIENGKQV